MPAPSPAEQFRAARLAFELAMELGCTPKEAERVMRRRARARRDACGRRAAHPIPARPEDIEPISDMAPADFRAWGAQWMLRD